ncbi:MAG TPA: glycoside hydrolase domain-containing protein [Pyrinomonadaceae bacterium]|jgi:hypothetical protein
MKRILSLIAAVVFCQSAFAATQSIWAVNDGEKIERDDQNNRNEKSNSVWDGRKIKIFAARNEIVAFQIVVEADAKGIERLSVRLPELARAGGGGRVRYVAPAADPTDYVGRRIQLFAVHYMNVTAASRADWIFKKNTLAAPLDPTGWKPVQLVPENAKAGRGGFPLRVAPNENQAVWIEIYTPRDLKAGTYRGDVAVTADGVKKSIPLELEVFDFELPDENSMSAMIYFESKQPELYMGRNLDASFHRFAHRQRVEFVHAYTIEAANAARARFTGEAFTQANKYEGPGEGVGNRVIPRSFYGPGAEFDEAESARRASDEWMTYLERNFPRAITFLYMPDEPAPAEYPRIRKIADNVHSNPGPGSKLPIFVTKKYVKELDGAIDIWDSGPEGFDIERAAAERAKGRRHWIYNGGRPAGGAITIDSPATDARATVWACFKHDVDVYFYWHGVHWQHNRQKQGERNQNVWANPITFDNRGQPNKPVLDQGFINGDGVLVYPGRDALHPAEDRGIDGPVSTVQLANFRRGLQDHQYLSLARRLGLQSEVEAALRQIVPKVFSDADDRVSFPENGDAYENARRRLAEAIARRLKKGGS